MKDIGTPFAYKISSLFLIFTEYYPYFRFIKTRNVSKTSRELYNKFLQILPEFSAYLCEKILQL